MIHGRNTKWGDFRNILCDGIGRPKNRGQFHFRPQSPSFGNCRSPMFHGAQPVRFPAKNLGPKQRRSSLDPAKNLGRHRWFHHHFPPPLGRRLRPQKCRKMWGGLSRPLPRPFTHLWAFLVLCPRKFFPSFGDPLANCWGLCPRNLSTLWWKSWGAGGFLPTQAWDCNIIICWCWCCWKKQRFKGTTGCITKWICQGQRARGTTLRWIYPGCTQRC